METSSHHNLQAFGDVEASALNGRGGNWLLDPFDITVVSGTADTNITEGGGNNGIFSPDSSGSKVSNGTINARLNNGTSVTIKTAKESSGSSQWGNITVTADISKTGGSDASLTLDANGSINITNHYINATTGKLDVNLYAAGSNDGNITLNNASITTNGGNITLGRKEGADAGKYLNIDAGNNVVLNASTGNVSLSAAANEHLGTYLHGVNIAGGNITVSASSVSGGSGVKIEGVNTLTATRDISITGNRTMNTAAYGVRVMNGSTFTAGNNITIAAVATNGSDGALKLEGMTLNATNTFLNGTSGSGNAAGVNGSITVEKGNLSLTGVSKSGGDISVSSADINVSAGELTLSGTGNLTLQGVKLSSNGDARLQGGNITLGSSGPDATNVSFTMTGSSDATLTVAASSNISVPGPHTSITCTGKLNVNMLAGKDIDNAAIGFGDYPNIFLNGGDFYAGPVDKESGHSVAMKFRNGGNISAGNITLDVSRGLDIIIASLEATDNLSINGPVKANVTYCKTQKFTAGNHLTINATGGSMYFYARQTTGEGAYGHLVLSGENGVDIHTGEGTINITSAGGDNNSVNITSTKGNISISGHTIGQQDSGVAIQNADLKASSGNINISGVGNTGSYWTDALFGGGIMLSGKVSFTSRHNILDGKDDATQYQEKLYGIGLSNDADIVFTGDTDINAHSDLGSGFLITSGTGQQKLTFHHGTATINATSNYNGIDQDKFSSVGGGIVFSGVSNTPSTFVINVSDGASLNISAQTKAGNGIASHGFNVNEPDNLAREKGFKFTGDGDVNIHSVSDSGDGLELRIVDNTDLTGNLTITGESKSGTGVSVPDFAGVSIVNATVTGISHTGAGIHINSGDTGHHPQVNLNGNSLTGTSENGTGINVSGNNVTITNGSLTGTSHGGGVGIQLTGGTDYTVDGASVTGQSLTGSGVSVGGNLTVSNATVNGDTVTGSGVSISGDLTSSNTAITGNASGKGSGVLLNGSVTGDSTDKNVITGHAAKGNGLLVSGESTVVNVTLNGTTVDGSGIKVTGNLTTNNVSATGNASGGGNGISLAGNVSGGRWTGNAVNGTGVNVAGNLTSAGSTTVSGRATDNGTGLRILSVSDVRGGWLSGESVSGPGGVLDGNNHLLSTTLTGSSGVGSGLLLNGMVMNTDSVLHGQSGSGDGVSLNGTVTGGSLSGQSGSGAGVHVTGNSSVSGVSVNSSSGSGQGLQLDGVLSTAGGTTLNGVVQRDSSAERRQVYELQNRLPHNNRRLKQVVTASGYREQEKPVVVEVCTDGESSCRHLDAGTPDRPLHP